MQTLPNSHPEIETTVHLTTPYHGACPHSSEPQAGSIITVCYTPADKLLELHAVAQWLRRFSEGTEAIDLETVAQQTAQAAAEALGVPVTIVADYILRNDLRMRCTCQSSPSTAPEKIKRSML